MAVREACALCGGTGWTLAQKDGVPGVARCECTKRDRLGRLMEGARIPGRYAHCQLDGFDTSPSLTTRSIDQAKFVAEKFVDEYPTSPPLGLLFMGTPGVGKTHLAVGIIRELIHRKGVECMFRTFPELLKEIQNTYNPISKGSELSLLAPVLEVEVLVLDELGAQNPSSWVLDTVGYILNHRYNENRVTIVTTNYLDQTNRRDARKGTADCLTDRIGDRMRSRLYEMCKTIPMEGSDFRQNVKHANHHF
jgi:DNA replication protein DnaC